jgi:chaperonin GroES
MARSTKPKLTSVPAGKKGPKLPESVRLTADRLIVDVAEDGERRSSGGLLIPATAEKPLKRCVWAEVILTGPDARTVKVGDHVLFLPHVGLEVEIEGREYVLLRERDVQAVDSSTDGKGKEPTPGQYL